LFSWFGIALLCLGGLRGLVWDNFYMQELWMNAPETIRVACVLGGGMSYCDVVGSSHRGLGSNMFSGTQLRQGSLYRPNAELLNMCAPELT
jgi:hypothetical protein